MAMRSAFGKPRIRHLRNRYLLGSDLILFAAATILSYALRFEGFEWGYDYAQSALVYLAVALPVKIFLFWRLGLYRRLWLYAGVVELERIIATSAASGLACLLLGALLLPGLGLTDVRVPLSVLFMDGLLTAASAALPRLWSSGCWAGGDSGSGWRTRQAGADRRRGRRGRDDRQGADRPSAAGAQPGRLRGRRSVASTATGCATCRSRAAVADRATWCSATRRRRESSSRCRGLRRRSCARWCRRPSRPVSRRGPSRASSTSSPAG